MNRLDFYTVVADMPEVKAIFKIGKPPDWLIQKGIEKGTGFLLQVTTNHMPKIWEGFILRGLE